MEDSDNSSMVLSFRRAALMTAACVLLVFVTLIAAVRIAATTEFGRDYVKNKVEATTVAGQNFSVHGLNGDLLSQFSAKTLQLSDEQGVWLIAHDLNVEWWPWALWERELKIEQVSAQSVNVLRRPNITPVPGIEKSGNSEWFRGGAIRALSVDSLQLQEGVAQRALDLSVTGTGLVSTDHINAQLDVSSIMPGGDEVSLDLTWSPETLLQGNAKIDSPPGGLFASLARIDAANGLQGTIEAGGIYGQWSGSAVFSAGSNVLIQASAKQDGGLVSFQANATPSSHPITAQFSEWTNNKLALQGVIDLSEAQPSLKALLYADKFSADITAWRDLNGSILSDIKASAKDLHEIMRRDELKIGAVQLEGKLTSIEENVSFDGNISAQNIAQSTAEFEQLSGPIRINSIGPSIVASTELASRLSNNAKQRFAFIGKQPILTFQGTYNLATSRADIVSAKVETDAIKLSAAGIVSFQNPILTNLKGQLQFTDPSARLPETFQTSAKWQAKSNNDGKVHVSMTGKASGFKMLPDILSDLLEETADYSLEGRISPSLQIDLSSLSAKSGEVQIAAHGQRLETGRIQLGGNLETGAASFYGASLPSTYTSLDVSGHPGDLSIASITSSPALTYKGSEVANLVLSLNSSYSASGLFSDVSMQAASGFGEIVANGRIHLDGSEWAVSNAQIAMPDLLAEASFSGDGNNLSRLRSEFAVNGSLPIFLPVQTIQLNGKLSGQELFAQGTLEGISAGQLTDAGMQFRLNGTPKNAAFDLTATGLANLAGIERDVSLSSSGSLRDILLPARSLTANLDGMIGRSSISTLTPARLAMTPKGVAGNVSLNAFGGRVELSLKDKPEERAEVVINNIQIGEILDLVGRIPREGVFDAKFHLQENNEKFEGQIQGQVSGLRQVAGHPSPLSFDLSGVLQDERIVVDIGTKDVEALSAAVTAYIPVITDSNSFLLRPNLEAGIEYLGDIKGPIGVLSSLFAPPEIFADGDIDLNISGFYPTRLGGVSGSLKLAAGKFEHELAGLTLKNIELSATLDADKVVLNKFIASDSSQGSLTGSGEMSLTGGTNNLALQANRLRIVERSEGWARASGDLELRQSNELIELAGKLIINDGQIYLDRFERGRPATLDVHFEDLQDADTVKREVATNLDIKLSAPRTVSIRGSGVVADITLDAVISGSFGNPQISGVSEIPRGRFELLGKRFEFQDSLIRINGNPMDAQLNITAIRTMPELSALVKVTGTPANPIVELSSEPSLPEDEVLSRVLFGRSPSQLTTFQAARLAAALAQLSGGGGFDLIGGLEQSLGLDTFDVSQNSNEQVQLTTGKYLADDVYLELQTTNSGTPGVAVEWTPRDNVEVEIETSADEGESISIQWVTDFD